MKGRRTGETQEASPKGLRLEPYVLEPKGILLTKMRREPTGRWLTLYNFYTHSFLLFFFFCQVPVKVEERSRAMRSQRGSFRGVSPFSVFWSLLRIPFIFVFYFFFANLNPLLKYFNFI